MTSLDVGCGFRHNQDTKKAELGIDLNKGLCDIQASVYYLPFRDQTFQKVVMSHIIEHLFNFGSAVKEVKRILKPNGVLEIEVPNPSSIKIFREYVFSRKPRIYTSPIGVHICSFGERELQNALILMGFKIVKMGYLFSSYNKKVAIKKYEKYGLLEKIFYRIFFRLFPAFQTAFKIEAKK